MTDSPDYESMIECLAQLEAAGTELRRIAAEEDLPAVERNAKRLEATVWMVRRHFPPELVDE